MNFPEVGRDRWARRERGSWVRRARPTPGLILLAFVASWLALPLRAAETIPPAPANHFNDYAGVVSASTAQTLDAELTQFERATSNQIIVAIYRHMASDSSIEDYTVRVAQSWRVGLKDKKNGAVLFIFSDDHKLYIQVGYGLEGVLPDALCKQIIANEITPQFRAGNYSAGVTAGVHALIAATKGEYKGTGRALADGRGSSQGLPRPVMFFFVIIFMGISFLVRRARGSAVYGRGGRFMSYGGGWGGGGGSGGGGGGSFSGGGGSFGGGGAGGSW